MEHRLKIIKSMTKKRHPSLTEIVYYNIYSYTSHSFEKRKLRILKSKFKNLK